MIKFHGEIKYLMRNNKSESISILRRIHSIVPESVLRNPYYTLTDPYFE